MTNGIQEIYIRKLNLHDEDSKSAGKSNETTTFDESEKSAAAAGRVDEVTSDLSSTSFDAGITYEESSNTPKLVLALRKDFIVVLT